MATFKSLAEWKNTSRMQHSGTIDPSQRSEPAAFDEMDRMDDVTPSGPTIRPSPSTSATTQDMDAAATLMALASSSSPSQSPVNQDTDMELEDEATEISLGILFSLHPNEDVDNLRKMLARVKGSVEEASLMITKQQKESRGKKRASNVSEGSQKEGRSTRRRYRSPPPPPQQELSERQHGLPEPARQQRVPRGLEALLSGGLVEEDTPKPQKPKRLTDSDGNIWEWKGKMNGHRRCYEPVGFFSQDKPIPILLSSRQKKTLAHLRRKRPEEVEADPETKPGLRRQYSGPGKVDPDELKLRANIRPFVWEVENIGMDWRSPR